jgi:hypothetical protein
MDLGTPFEEEQLPQAEENIRKLLMDNGYFDAAIGHRLDYDAAFQQVAIMFTIDTGRRAISTRLRNGGDCCCRGIGGSRRIGRARGLTEFGCGMKPQTGCWPR